MEFPMLYACRYVDDLFCYISTKYNLRKESPLGMRELKQFIPRTFTEAIAEIIDHDEYVNKALAEARMFDFDWNVYLNASCYSSYYLFGFCQRLSEFTPLAPYGIFYTSAFISRLCIYCVLMDNQEALYTALCVLIIIVMLEQPNMTLKRWSFVNIIAEEELDKLGRENLD